MRLRAGVRAYVGLVGFLLDPVPSGARGGSIPLTPPFGRPRNARPAVVTED